jgi:hypothetical protein
MPPPGPCDAKALAAGSTAHAAMAARDSLRFFRGMTISRDNRLRKATDQNGAGFEIFRLRREPGRAMRIHLCGAGIHSTFTSLPLVFGFCVAAIRKQLAARRWNVIDYSRRIHVNVKKILGFLAIGGLLALAVPAERAQALSLASPGVAAAVQDDSGKLTTEVRWHRHHGWRGHRGWHRHYGWRRHHWHHRHWRRW